MILMVHIYLAVDNHHPNHIWVGLRSDFVIGPSFLLLNFLNFLNFKYNFLIFLNFRYYLKINISTIKMTISTVKLIISTIKTSIGKITFHKRVCSPAIKKRVSKTIFVPNTN